MIGPTLSKRLVVALLAGCGLLAGVPASAAGPEPIPPACDPRVVGIGVPACPSVLLGEVGDVENPGYALPDLVPNVTEVYVDYQSIEMNEFGQWEFGTAMLNFDTHAENHGKVPVEISADDPTAIAGSPVSQCISWTTDFVCRKRHQVGGFTWHDEHKHYHFEGFASYELRRLQSDGQPDFSGAGLVSTSPKVSVCLVDSRKVDPNARPVPRYNTCNPLEEGISPGWTDVYPSGIDGQMLPLTGVTDGKYAVVISLNGEHRLLETDSSNNRVIAVVEVSGINTFLPAAAIVDKWHG